MGFPRMHRVVEKERNLMAGFVAVGVLADEAGDVLYFTGDGHRRTHFEQGVEFCYEFFFTAEQIYQILRILKHVPEVVPGVGFSVVAALLACMCILVGLERFSPVALRVLPAEETGGRVEKVAVIAGAGLEEGAVLLFAKGLGELRGAPVVKAGLEGAGDRLVFNEIEGVVAVFVVDLPVGLFVRSGQRGLDGCPGALLVNSGEIPQAGIHDRRHGVVPDHAVVVLAAEVPDGTEAVEAE